MKIYYNGIAPCLTLTGDNHVETQSNELAIPVSVFITSSDGTALTNAPLVFGVVSNGAARFAATTNTGAWTTNLPVRSDADGLASAWLFLPTNAFVTNELTLTTVGGTNPVVGRLAAWVVDPASSNYLFLSEVAMTPFPAPLGTSVKVAWRNYNEVCHFRPGVVSFGTRRRHASICQPARVHQRQHCFDADQRHSGLFYQLLSSNQIFFKTNSDLDVSNWAQGQVVQCPSGATQFDFDPVPTNGGAQLYFEVKVSDTLVSAQTFQCMMGFCSIAARPCLGNPATTATLGININNQTGSTATNLTVYYQMSGSAINGVDYTNEFGTNLPGAAFIPVSLGNTNLQLIPLPNNTVFDETATLTLLPNSNYVVDPLNASATATIQACVTNSPFAVVTNQLNYPAGIGYDPFNQSLIVSVLDGVELGDGNGYFLQFYTNGMGSNLSDMIVEPWSGVTNIDSDNDELYFTVIKTNAGGFTNGWIYFANGYAAGEIGRISPDSLSYQTNWTTLTNADGSIPSNVRLDLCWDETGIFSNDLIAVEFDNGNVWRIDSSGYTTNIAQLPSENVEGVITLPNTNIYGPWAGKIVTGSENDGYIYSIDTNGTVVAFTNLNIHTEAFQIIPTNQDLYLAADETNSQPATTEVFKLSRDYFTNDVGNLLIVQENSSSSTVPKLFVVKWDGTNFVTKYIEYEPGNFEHAVFAPIYLPAQ